MITGLVMFSQACRHFHTKVYRLSDAVSAQQAGGQGLKPVVLKNKKSYTFSFRTNDLFGGLCKKSIPRVEHGKWRVSFPLFTGLRRLRCSSLG